MTIASGPDISKSMTARSASPARSILSFSSERSVLSAWSAFSLMSAGTLLSVGSSLSVASVGSFASVLSVGSSQSVLSVGAHRGFLTVGRADERAHRTLHFVSLISSALTAGLAFAHALEMPVKMRLEKNEYMTTQRIYPYYGKVGGFFEAAALLTTLALAAVSRRRPRTFRLTATAAVSLALVHGLFWFHNFPVNRRTKNWAISPASENWRRLRNRWERSHAGRAALATLALGALAAASSSRK